MKKPNLRRQLARPLGALVAAIAAYSLLALPTALANIPTPSTESDPNRFLVVDCLLPGQVRKLGGQMTYLSPRRPTKATTSECEIRGGEYVAYDRANYATSLQVWLPKAKDGDAQAETYVGEIFEKGMGQPSDPGKAAEWYQKAADQGYQRALSNLAYLYEKGLGVPQDPLKALNLYRRAAGINDDQLTFASEVTAVRQETQSQLDTMAAQLEQQTAAADQLRQQLSDSQQQVDSRRAALAASRREAADLRRQLADAKQASPADSAERTAKLQQLENDLRAREARIAQQQNEMADLEKTTEQRKSELESRIAAANSQDAALRKQLGEKSSDSASARAQLAAAQERLLATNQRVDELTAQLNAERESVKRERERLTQDLNGANGANAGKQAENERMRQALAERESQLAQQSGLIASLQSQKKDYDQQISRLKAQQATQEQQKAEQAAEIQNVRAELASTQQRYLETQQRLSDATSALDAQRAQLAAERSQIAAEQDRLAKQHAAATADQLKEVARLAQEVSKREAQLIEQRAQIAALEADRNEYSERIARLKPEAATLAMRSADAAPAAAATAPRGPMTLPRGLEAGTYYALIIGNNSYQYMPNLDTAVNDARSVDKVLRERYGFKTRVLENATRAQLLSALNDYRTSLKDSDNLLIYYAGHGELDAKNLRGYWLPINARREDTTEWISDQMITDQIGLMSARHVLVVADSCYSGAMTRSSGLRLVSNGGDDAEGRRLTTLSKLPSRTVLTSGGEKPVLDGGGGTNSIFARALLDVLTRNDRVLEGSALWNQLFDPVKRAAARFKVDQSPRYSALPDAGHMNGEFLFVPRAG